MTALILLNGGVSLALHLGLGRRLILASVRAAAQLALLGFVLHWIFALERWPLVLGLMLAMASLAGFEAVRRTSLRLPGMGTLTVATMLVTSMSVTAYATGFVLRVEPWYEPRYLIPVLDGFIRRHMHMVAGGADMCRIAKGLAMAFGTRGKPADQFTNGGNAFRQRDILPLQPYFFTYPGEIQYFHGVSLYSIAAENATFIRLVGMTFVDDALRFPGHHCLD